MKKSLILFGFIWGLSTFSYSYNNLSKDIYKSQIKQFGNIACLNTFLEIRNHINCFSDISLSVKDTLFLVESYVYNVETGNKSYYLTMFNHKRNLSFKTKITNTNKLELINNKHKSKKNNFEIEKLGYSYISNFLIKLIQEWNLIKIDNESEKHTVQYPSQIYITRIIIDKKRFKIACHCFDEFYNLQEENY